jgi:NAD(P)H-dependent flavin oxidoreductase YrpB (nitropropane dioxygenase family)
MKTALCHVLGVEHPIIAAPMGLISPAQTSSPP